MIENLKHAKSTAKLYAFLRAEAAAGRPFPSKECIMAHMRWRCWAGNQVLRLEAYGLIRRVGYDGKKVRWALTETAHAKAA